MKITKIDNIPGHVGVITHDSDIEPMLVELSEHERFLLANSPHHGKKTVFFPDTMSYRSACDIIEGLPFSGKKTSGLPSSKLKDVILAMDAGMLDHARRMLLKGIMEDMDSEPDAPVAGQEP